MHLKREISWEKIKCISCGKEKEIKNYNSTQDIINEGFSIAFDISNGLTTIRICSDCTKKIKEHVLALENIFNKPIDEVNLMYFSKKG